MSSDITFYIHFSPVTLDILSVSTNSTPADGLRAIPIDFDDGIALAQGLKYYRSFCIVQFADGTFDCVTRTAGMIKHPTKRLEESGAIYEITELKRGADKNAIHLVINRAEDIVEIHYNGQQILKDTWNTTKMYFTKADDMSFLICSFSLDNLILDSIKNDNELSEWPNPILLKIDTSDLSVFGIKSQPPVSLEIKNDTTRNK